MLWKKYLQKFIFNKVMLDVGFQNIHDGKNGSARGKQTADDYKYLKKAFVNEHQVAQVTDFNSSQIQKSNFEQKKDNNWQLNNYLTVLWWDPFGRCRWSEGTLWRGWNKQIINGKN